MNHATARFPGALRLRRTEADADPATVATLLRALDSRPGMYYGSDYASDPLFRHEACLFVDPAVRLTLTQGILALEPLDSTGAAIVRHWSSGLSGNWRDDGAFVPDLPAWDSHGAAHHPAARLLRRLLAQFAGDTRDFALFGCWNADYWRLEGGSGVSPSAARAVLYLPLSLLVIHGSQVRALRFTLAEGMPAGDDLPASTPTTAARPADTVPSPSFPPLPAEDDFPSGGFAERVAQALAALARGDVLSVALSQAFRRPWSASVADAFASLRERYPMPEMYCIHLGAGEFLMGASPCMQARLHEGMLDIAPVCGTAARGVDAMADAGQALALLQSDKEGAALAVGTDEHLARLYPLCRPDSVQVLAYRRVHHFQALIHEMAHIGGRLAEDVDWLDVLLATSATATSTGVPKREALALIAATEASPRGWYTGAVGRIGVDGSLRVGTIMRPAWVRDRVVEVRTGSLLVGSSDPVQEEEETRVKAASLLTLLARTSASPPGAATESQPVVPASEPREPHLPAAGAAHRTVWLASGNDPLQAVTAGLLARAGAHVVKPPDTRPAPAPDRPVALRVLTAIGPQTPPDDLAYGPPTLLLGGAAEGALQAWGWRGESPAGMQHGHGIEVHPGPAPLLASLDPFMAGDYPTRRFPAADAPAELSVLATDGAGILLAFQHRTQPVIGLLFRPESVLATGSQAGFMLLARLLHILAPAGFPDPLARPQDPASA